MLLNCNDRLMFGRLMEKDNKKLRDDARKEYNETVRVSRLVFPLHFFPSLLRIQSIQSLVKFIRKRDPRYKKHLESQSTSNNIPSSSNAKPTVKIPIPDYVEQDWQKVETRGLHADLDWAAAEGEDLEEWECVACRKTFHSEPAWNSHERSKKHMKEVERLRREMEAEDQRLDLEINTTDDAEFDVTKNLSNLSVGNESDDGQDTDGLPESRESSRVDSSRDTNAKPSKMDAKTTEDRKTPPFEAIGEDAEPPSRRRRARRRNSLDRPEGLDSAPPQTLDQKTNEAVALPELSKRDKRRAKQQSKQTEASTTDSSLVCSVTHNYFTNKLNSINPALDLQRMRRRIS